MKIQSCRRRSGWVDKYESRRLRWTSRIASCFAVLILLQMILLQMILLQMILLQMNETRRAASLVG